MTHPTRKTFAELREELKTSDSTYWKRDARFAYNHRSDVLFQMPNGKARRAEIIRLLQADVSIRVDARYCLQVKNDRDVQKLINDGVCRIQRHRTWWNSSQKFLRLVKVRA